MNRRILACLLSIMMLMTMVVPMVNVPNAQAAEPDSISKFVKDMQNVYKYMDDTDKDAIRTARTNLDSQDLSSVINPLLTDEVKSKLGGDAVARGKLVNFVKDLNKISYSQSADQLKTDLTTFKTTHQDTFTALFGTEITVDDLYNLLLACRNQLPNTIKSKTAYINLAKADDTAIINTLPQLSADVLNTVIARNEFKKFDNKLSDIGWSVQKLSAAQADLAAKIDIADPSARIAMIKALVRSQAVLYNSSGVPASVLTWQVGSKPEYTLKILGQEATGLVQWTSLPSGIIGIANKEGKLQISADKAGTTKLIAYRNHTGAAADKDWIYEIKVTVIAASPADPGGGGGGGGGGGFAGTPVTADTGGTVSDAGATLEIPANAMDENFKVKIEQVSSSGLILPENTVIIGHVIEFTKNKLGKFSKPVTITLRFDKNKVDFAKVTLKLCWYDSRTNKWVELDNVKIDKESGKISGQIDHFTKFAILATAIEKPKPPVKPEPPVVNIIDIKGHWAEPNIIKLIAAGGIAGYPDQTFRPNNTITRAEFATILVKSLKLEAKQGKVFQDTANHWAKDAISTANAYGIINGYSNTIFGPDDLITREQMAVMLYKAANLTPVANGKVFTDRAKIAPWARDAVAAVSAKGIIAGYPDGSFGPKANASRAEAATVIVQIMK